MKEALTELGEIYITSWKWVAKHWKGYLLFLIIVTLIEFSIYGIAYGYFDPVVEKAKARIEKIKNKGKVCVEETE